MAAVAGGVQTVNITINDIEVQVPKGELIVESVKRLGLEVPIFCYHPRMKPVGMCRMCLVEVGMKQPDGSVRKMPKPQTACSLPASEGLVIYTDTALIHNDRKGVLEFLLINHPLDCPICDRGGECPLQNNTLFYGPSTSRFVEMKRHAPKAFPLSQYVTLDLERCIQCGRCVRFTEEISGDAQLGFRFRGASMQPSTFQMTDFDSKFSGNVIEICPVGALTSAKYRFRARPWDLQTRPGICTLCSNGCNVYVDFRSKEIARINGRTNEGVNEEWTCDRGKFGHYQFNTDKRLSKPMVRQGNALVGSEWSAAYAEVLRAFSNGGSAVAAIGGATNSNEDLYMLARLFRDRLGSENLDHRFERALLAPEESLEAKMGVQTVQNTIGSFEEISSALVFGTSLADEEPILFLRLRKAWFQTGAKVVVAHDQATDVDSFANLILRYRPGTAATLANGLLAAAVAGGKAQVPPQLAERLAGYSPERVEAETGVSAADLQEAAEILAGAPIVTTRGLYDLEGGAGIAETLAGFAVTTGGTFNNYARLANEEGAALLGFQPRNGGMNTHQILEGCANGSIRALWLVGADAFKQHADRSLVERALENVEFLVVQDWQETEAMSYASVVLPMTAPMEGDGTYTNLERRVQRFRQVLPERGEAKPAWRTFEELSMRLKPMTPMFNPRDIMDRIAAEVPAFAGVAYDKLGGEGFVLGQGPDEDAEERPPVQVNG